MTFRVVFSPKSYKLYEKLVKGNRSIQTNVNRMIAILEEDPYNLSRQFDIKRLANERIGAWRIRNGLYRIRYDIEGEQVQIIDVFHRKRGYR